MVGDRFRIKVWREKDEKKKLDFLEKKQQKNTVTENAGKPEFL